MRFNNPLTTQAGRSQRRCDSQDQCLFDELSRRYRLYDNQAAVSTTYTEYDYDLAGNPTGATDALSRLTQTFYDELNRVDYIIDADGNTIDFDYDAMDNLTEVVDQRGVTTTYEYDRFENLTREISADRGTINYEYDMGSTPALQTHQKGS